jgi:hypothetical protein
MSGMLEVDSSRCLNLTAEFKFENKQIQTVKMVNEIEIERPSTAR